MEARRPVGYLLVMGLVCLILMLLFGGCVGLQQGPPVDAATVAVPTVVEDAIQAPRPVAVPPPVPPAPKPRGSFKAWIPRHTTPNGDIHEGHYVDISEKAPQKELMKPDYDVPKAPKQIYRPSTKTTGRAAPSSPQPQTQSPPLQQAPWLHQPQATPPAVPGSLLPVPAFSQEGGYEPTVP